MKKSKACNYDNQIPKGKRSGHTGPVSMHRHGLRDHTGPISRHNTILKEGKIARERKVSEGKSGGY